MPDNRHIPVLFTGQEQAVIRQSPPIINFVVNNQTGVPLQVKQAQALTQQGPGLYQQVGSIHAAAMNPSYRRAHGI
ncbi:MAG: hypothetical protein KJ621_06070 [Proteobacteria bacterium]|nr:hypothetical protein [Pseudomonadota bacterium]